MPTMRDMALFALSQRVTQVVDHGPQVGPRGEPLLEPLEQRLAVAALVDQAVPLRAPPDDRLRLGPVARLEPGPLPAEPLPRLAAHALRLGLLERLLHLQHLQQQLP